MAQPISIKNTEPLGKNFNPRKTVDTFGKFVIN